MNFMASLGGTIPGSVCLQSWMSFWSRSACNSTKKSYTVSSISFCIQLAKSFRTEDVHRRTTYIRLHTPVLDFPAHLDMCHMQHAARHNPGSTRPAKSKLVSIDLAPWFSGFQNHSPTLDAQQYSQNRLWLKPGLRTKLAQKVRNISTHKIAMGSWTRNPNTSHTPSCLIIAAAHHVYVDQLF